MIKPVLKRDESVIARTAGILKGRSLSLTTEEERAAAEQGIAEETAQRGKR